MTTNDELDIEVGVPNVAKFKAQGGSNSILLALLILSLLVAGIVTGLSLEQMRELRIYLLDCEQSLQVVHADLEELAITNASLEVKIDDLEALLLRQLDIDTRLADETAAGGE